MRFFWRSRADDDFLEAVRPELRALATPPATEGLRARIFASRVAGTRVILPDVPRAPEGPRWTVALAIAVVILLMLAPFQLRRSETWADEFTSAGFLWLTAAAQPPQPVQSRPAAVRLTAMDRLHALSLAYTRRRFDSTGRFIDTTVLTLGLRDVPLDGARAWRLARLDQNPVAGRLEAQAETVYMSPADLHLLRRDIHVTPYSRFQRINVQQRFAADSVSGRMFTEGPSIGEGRLFRRRLASDGEPVLSEAMAPVFFLAVRLDRGWSGSAALLGWAVRDDDVLMPVTLRVDGEETITVPAGRFACWRLTVRVAGRESQYWARKSDGLGIRVLARDAHTNGIREVVLSKEH